MANWIPLTLGRAFLEPMEIASSHLLAVVDLFANLLIVLGQIIEILGMLITGFFNALAAAINALLASIKNFLNDLLSTGFYMFPYAPIVPQTTKRFSEWLEVAASSFDKKADKHRPEFSEDAYVGALVACVAFPTFEELIAWWQSFLALWTTGWDFSSKWPTHSDPADDLGGEAPNPHWSSLALKDIEPVRKTVRQWIAVLDKFTLFEDINTVIQNFATMLKRKGEALQAFASYTKQVILDLLKALSQTGVWLLPVYGRGGNELVQSALRSASGTPATVKSSAQKGAEEAIAQLRTTVANVAGIQADTTFIAPQNDKGNWDTTKRMQADLEEHLDRLENDVRINPQGRLTTLVDKALMSDEQEKEYKERRKAGYPDAASYWQAVPGYTDTSSRPPNTVSAVSVQSTPAAASEYLASLSTDATRPATNPNTDSLLEGVDPDTLPFRVSYRVATETIAAVSDDQAAKAVDIDVAGVYAEGRFTNSDTDVSSMLKVLAAVKSEVKHGGVVVVDLHNVTYTDILPDALTKAEEIAQAQQIADNPTDPMSYKVQTSIDLTMLVTNYILTDYWTSASNLIFISDDQLVTAQMLELKTTLDTRKSTSGAVITGPLGAGDDSAATIMPTVTGTANDVGTRSMGEYLGDKLSDMLGKKLDDASVPVPSITYDENGKSHVTYTNQPRKQLGSRFSPTTYPDFAGNNNITIGVVFLAGGPSEAPAEALFNLFGVSAAAGETVGFGAEKTAETATTGASAFNNFGENYNYSRAKERVSGNTLNWP